MKTILPFLFLSFALRGFAQIPNSSFETWVYSTGSSHSYFLPQSWISLDPLVNLINPSYTVASVVQTSQSHTGNKAVLLQTAIGGGDTVGGALMSTGSMSTFFGGGIPGFACSTRPANFNSYYKFTPVGGDEAVFAVWMTKWNSGTNRRDTIGMGFSFTNFVANVYTLMSVPITYSVNVMPDTAVIEVVLGGAGGSNTHVGSVLYLDDFAFAGAVPFGIYEAEQMHLQVYPNPATNALTISMPDEIGLLELSNAVGEVIYRVDARDKHASIDMTELPRGIYFLRTHSVTRKIVKQ